MTDHAPMQLEKHSTCFIERRWHIYLTNPLTQKASYWPLSVRSTQDSKILMMVLEAVM